MPIAVPVFRPLSQLSRVEQNREYDRRRKQAKPWRRLYDTALWKRRRREQLEREPLCALCAERGVTTLAAVAHHVMAHRGDWELFAHGELQSLCKRCHDSEAQAEEAAADKSGRGGG